MKNTQNSEAIFIRTFDLPDIHFTSVSGLEAPGNHFSATRVCQVEEVDSIALDRWYEQTKNKQVEVPRRDCWLEIEGKIFLVWGTNIKTRKYLDDAGEETLEKWEFSFDELRKYKNSNN